MRTFLRDDTGAVTTDWVVLLAALLGLGVAVLSMISTGSLDLAARTSTTLSDTDVPVPTIPTPVDPVVVDGDTNFFPWVARTDRDDAGFWAYNSQNQLIDYETGDVLPIIAMESIGDSEIVYSNARGEQTDSDGIVLAPQS